MQAALCKSALRAESLTCRSSSHLLLWFESNGSHRHLRVTLPYWQKVAYGAFCGNAPPSSFGGDRKARLSVAWLSPQRMSNLVAALRWACLRRSSRPYAPLSSAGRALSSASSHATVPFSADNTAPSLRDDQPGATLSNDDAAHSFSIGCAASMERYGCRPPTWASR